MTPMGSDIEGGWPRMSCVRGVAGLRDEGN